MKVRLMVVLVIVLASGGSGLAAPASQAPEQASEYIPVHSFDPARDASADIRAALAEARRTGKRVLLDVGGTWCPYCQEMDTMFAERKDLRELRDESFITVAVSYGAEGKNEKALADYPAVEGIPHLYVIEKDGTLVHSQHVVELRSGGVYSVEKMRSFLEAWSVRHPQAHANDGRSVASVSPAHSIASSSRQGATKGMSNAQASLPRR